MKSFFQKDILRVRLIGSLIVVERLSIFAVKSEKHSKK
jgi:hypothetical protein